jgi:MFS family permease
MGGQPESSLRNRALGLFVAHQTTMHLATAAGLNVALPAMARDFNAGIGTVIWVQVAYGVALAAGTIPVGQLSRILNRRQFVLASNAVTILFELIIVFAPNIYVLILARAVESISRAVPWLVLQVVAIGGFRPEQRGRVLGFTRLVQGIALTISPAITGYVTDHWGWRWMFVGSVVIFGVIQLGLLRWFPAQPASEERSKALDLSGLDVGGACLLCAGLVGVLSAVQLASGSQAQAAGIGLAACGLALLAGFVAVELRASSPMLPLAVFREAGVALASIQAVFLGVVNGALPVVLPLLFISGYGWTAAYAGAVLLFLNVARVPFAPAAGWAADRYGAGRVIVGATAVSVAGQVLAASLHIPPPVTLVALSLGLIGLGQGIVAVANLKQIFSAMPAEQLHLAPATNIVLLQLGTAAGQAFVGAAYGAAGLGSRLAGPDPLAVAVSSSAILVLTAVFAGGMLLAYAAPPLLRARSA